MKARARFRIIVDDPVPGVVHRVQEGRDGLLAPVEGDGGSLVFEFTLTIADATSDPPRLTGPCAQGPPAQRFVYVNSGSAAGDGAACWRRRAKVPLRSVGRADLEAVADRSDALLEARIHGRSKDGGPACASVPLLAAWRRVEIT